ncbi:MAG TPA: sensor histidine kinase [Gaiellaceae bacterium]|nr:sensor histidine kinase [Gaiellaceae bacterium]
MQVGFSFLARRRLLAVALAFAVEAAILVGLAYAEPREVVGIPAVVVAAVAGTVAVVFGPADGALVAFGGAVVFVVAAGGGAGALAALVAWPAIVAAAGLFAVRVSRHRVALGQVVAAQELERRRLAEELHDETAQTLASALMTLARAESASSPHDAAAAHRTLRELLQETIRSLRSLAVDLRPRSLDDFGLVTSMERLGTTFGERTGIRVDLRLDSEVERLPSEAELALYRVAQEALANVAQHAHAATVRVTLERTASGAVLVVRDDGRGFDPHSAGEAGLGLAGLRQRVELVGGRLAVTSRPGDGATVRAEIRL